jgi:succinate dehydrogenase / fumarate reductase cytochrome b subunit
MAEADPAPLPLEQRRPLSPHLLIYKLSPTMVVSGAHRVSGMVLYIGTLLLAWFLLAAASDKGSFQTASAFFGSIFGQLLLFGYTFALMLHAVGGVRHAIWDSGHGFDPEMRNLLAFGSLISAGVLTVLIWIAVFILR